MNNNKIFVSEKAFNAYAQKAHKKCLKFLNSEYTFSDFMTRPKHHTHVIILYLKDFNLNYVFRV